jgi:hypothetical protein
MFQQNITLASLLQVLDQTRFLSVRGIPPLNERKKDMNRITGIVLVALGLAVLQPATSAENSCRKVTGRMVAVADPSSHSATGTLTNGGFLNGTTVAVFNSPPYPTPIATQVTFTSTFTLTTDHGQLNGNATYLFDFATGQGTAFVKIDPAAGTGLFAEATGILFINNLKSDTVGTGPYHELIEAQICFAHGVEPPEEE